MSTPKHTVIHDCTTGATFVAGPDTHVLEGVIDATGTVEALAAGHDPFEIGSDEIRHPFAGAVEGKTGVPSLTALRQAQYDLSQMAAAAEIRAGRALLLACARTVAATTDVRGVRLHFVLAEESEGWRYRLGPIEAGGIKCTEYDLDEADLDGDQAPVRRVVEALEQVEITTDTEFWNLLELLNESALPMARAWHRAGQRPLGWLVEDEFVTYIEQDSDTGQAPPRLVADLEQILATDQRLDG